MEAKKITEILKLSVAIIALVTSIIALISTYNNNKNNNQKIGSIVTDITNVKQNIDFTNNITSSLIEFNSPKFKKRNKYSDEIINNWLEEPSEIVNNGLDGKFLINGKIYDSKIKNIKINVIISDRPFEQCVIEVNDDGTWDGWIYLRLNEKIKKTINFILYDKSEKEIGVYNIDLFF